MLSSSETLSAFLVPITVYKTIGKLQTLLLRVAVSNGNQTLAATRLLSILNDSDVSSLLLNTVTRFSQTDLSESDYQNVSSLQTILDAFSPFKNTVRAAIDEAKEFLPDVTANILIDYTNDGSVLDTLAAPIFLIMAANLQD